MTSSVHMFAGPFVKLGGWKDRVMCMYHPIFSIKWRSMNAEECCSEGNCDGGPCMVLLVVLAW